MKESTNSAQPFADLDVGDRFACEGVLASARGQDFLFSGASQSVFELNASGAIVWNELAAGSTLGQAIDRLSTIGLAGETAREAVLSLVAAWLDIGLVRPAARDPDPQVEAGRAQTLGICGLRARIVYPQGLASDTASAFRHLEAPPGRVDLCLEVIARAGYLSIFQDGRWAMSCRPQELPVALKGLLLQCILDRADYAVAFHAATVVADGQAILLLGPPGRGKTTLALSMVHGGYGFGGDDVALIGSDSRCTPVPFAAAVKTGSRALLSDWYPGLDTLTEFRRPDGRRVRYLPPTARPDPADLPVRSVVVLDRTRSGDASLTPLEAPRALASMIHGAHAPEEKLSDDAFRVLVGLIGSLPVLRLSYSRSEDAVAAIRAHGA